MIGAVKSTSLLLQAPPVRAALPLRPLALLFFLVALHGNSQAAIPSAMPNGPLVQFIDTDEREDHADISVQFSCSVRYLSNMPISHGSKTTIRLRLGPDCGSLDRKSVV